MAHTKKNPEVELEERWDAVLDDPGRHKERLTDSELGDHAIKMSNYVSKGMNWQDAHNKAYDDIINRRGLKAAQPSHTQKTPEVESEERWDAEVDRIQRSINVVSGSLLSRRIRDWAKSVPVENVIALVAEIESVHLLQTQPQDFHGYDE